MRRASGSSSRPRYADPSPASTRRDQIDSEIGRGHNLPVVDEQGQIWLDWEEKQEYIGLMDERGDTAGGWVGFPNPQDGRESDEESVKRPHDPQSRALLDAFTFQGGSTSGGTHTHDDSIPPDEPIPRPKGKARIRRVRTSESLRAGSAPIVIPPVPSQHHPIQVSEEDAAEEFFRSSFDPPLFTPTPGELEGLKNAGKRGSIFRSIAKKFSGRK